MSTNKNIIDDGFRSDLVRFATFHGTFEISGIKNPRNLIISKDTIRTRFMYYPDWISKKKGV